MCGIIYAKNLIGKDPVNNLVKLLYQNQKERGQQGFGFVGINGESIDTYRSTDEKGIKQYLSQKPYSEILFHHRNPTSTQNTLKSTHPFVINLDCKGYYLVHNGIIQNDAELHKGHKDMGIAYESQEGEIFNDSEALAWDFCLWLNGQQEQMKAQGAVAFVCLETDENGRAHKLYFYRNGGVPLKVYRDGTLLVVSSEGGYPSVKENCLYCWDYNSRQILKKGHLEIPCPGIGRQIGFRPYSFYADDEPMSYTEYIAIQHRELEELRRERDRFISQGLYDDADFIQEQIADIEYQLKGRI